MEKRLDRLNKEKNWRSETKCNIKFVKSVNKERRSRDRRPNVI